MLLPPAQIEHGITPEWSHDDRARQAFQRTLREGVVRRLSPSARQLFEKRVKPRFEKQHGRAPERQDAKREMRKEPYYQCHLSIQRAAQELMWASITVPLERQRESLADRARGASSKLGTLRLNPALETPRYVNSLDIHCMPGGYTSDLGEGDVSAGALYDKGTYIYSAGRSGVYGDRSGSAIVRYLQRKHPAFQPTRILDMGCATGNNTLAFCDAFPSAEVHGIDVGAGLLRYGHLRAESLGKAAHFSQQNAEKTDFADASFDLVTSCIMFHETSRSALPRIFAETRRLLKPDGVMVHLEVAQFGDLDLWSQVVFDAETYNNNEPFWTAYREMNLRDVAAEGGWPMGSVNLDMESVDPSAPGKPLGANPTGGFLMIAGRKD